MQTLNDLLEAAAKKLGTDEKPISESRLGDELGAYKQKLYDWKNGRGQPDTYAVWRLAEILKMNPLEVSAIIEAERAKSDERRSFWEDQVKRFRSSIQAVLLGLGLLMAYGTLPHSEAKAALITNGYQTVTPNKQMFIMSSRVPG
ncbi:hypothetical protein [Chitinimonas taiwanensis]|uniref:HTH cro/C1-type domain-containing protein n=1 Tax=Chitinimonas taiwanensis DSM 18899 TaxID=1121279 RepID=A0A1K2HM15_9NEIS|nr:hypothetical protein [Chitinimonas taiwanensis]SFZ77609.1 hypothetical protein SAMN02745887_02519 [Chitinimonas taiwanensis DSM 18899]